MRVKRANPNLTHLNAGYACESGWVELAGFVWHLSALPIRMDGIVELTMYSFLDGENLSSIDQIVAMLILKLLLAHYTEQLGHNAMKGRILGIIFLGVAVFSSLAMTLFSMYA